jgi:hypothetical protein
MNIIKILPLQNPVNLINKAKKKASRATAGRGQRSSFLLFLKANK